MSRTHLLRLVAVAAVALFTGSTPTAIGVATPAPSSPAAVAAIDAIESTDAVAASYYEAKLRKMHLVRPDLISYPLFFDVIC